jgi:Uma2 family endonuclease
MRLEALIKMAVPSFARTSSVDEYLKSSYRPDVDFVDGHLEERNLGEYDHATIQTFLVIWFAKHDIEWGLRTRVEQRVQVSESRFRVPDVCSVRRDQKVEQVQSQAPLICIEILSPDDTHQRLRDRVADYLRMGVENVWILDPSRREAFVCTQTGWNEPADGILRVTGTEINVPLAEIFSGLDES